MRVAVLNAMVPFRHGGAESLANDLLRNLRAAGLDAELWSIPFQWFPSERLLDEMLAVRGLRLRGVDRVIGLKFPAYLLPHDNKVMWLVHQHRQAYDMWDNGQSGMDGGPRSLDIRDAVRRADTACFAGCRAMYAIAGNVAQRLRQYNGIHAEVLHMPLAEPGRFAGGEAGNYVLAGGRLSPAKRQDLLVRAMAHVRSPVRLVVAGPPDTPADAARLHDLVAELDLGDRVTVDARFLPADELADLVNHALAVAYVPRDEDAIGYVTMEACEAAKPVIACTDSGGLLELLRDGVTGPVTPPEPEALAAAMDALHGDPAGAVRLGRQARDEFRSRNITWAGIMPRLLA